jgi:SAM-dependent methyltransferase
MPRGMADQARRVRKVASTLAHRGDRYACPICQQGFGSFLPAGGRVDALCPGCRSAERHRKMALILTRATPVQTTPQRILHIAPEPALRTWLSRLGTVDYVCADLLRGDVDLRLDITAMDLPDASFDGVICSHVLEHIDDDVAALRELRRVLRPDGWALLNVPHEPGRDTTYEDPSITSPEGRLEAFGQDDHVRIYAREDFTGRVTKAGFSYVDTFPISAAEVERFRLEASPDFDLIIIGTPAG